MLDEFVQTLLERGKTANPSRKWTVGSELAVKSIDQLPFITHDELSDGQTANGPGLWTVHLTLSVYQEGKTALNAVTADLYDFVHGWESDPSGRIDDVGWVQKVEDTSLFSTPGSVSMIGKTIRQANGLFDLRIHTL